MVFVYAMAWLLIPMEGESSNIYSRAINDRRGIRLVIAILIPVLIALQLVTSTLHLGFVGFVIWPVFLAVGVVILIWRNASESGTALDRRRRRAHARRGHPWRWPPLADGPPSASRRGRARDRPAGRGPHDGRGAAARRRRRPGHRGIVVIFGPWWLSLVRDLIAERQARALAEERAQMAAHVHDSVLQTLALIQRSADDPQHVVRLARAQERELRSWLFEGRPPGTIGDDATMLAEGVGVLQRQVEADHGIAVQVVMVGDCELSDGPARPARCAREATVNAAKWSGAPQVSLYAEVEPDTVMLYVRDRGHGFDPDAVPEDRQGIAQSIRARMTRFGGSAVIRSAPGQGAEVELSMPRREPGSDERCVGTGPRRGGRVIFLVEDHAVFRAGVRAELGEAVDVVGEADEAGGGRRAHQRARAGRRPARCPPARRRRPGRPRRSPAPPPRGAVPRPVGVRRPRGRDRRHPGGARGYITKTISGDELLQAVYRVGAGRRCVLAPPGRFRARCVLAGSGAGRGAGPTAGLRPELDQLSPREREVLRLIARGTPTRRWPRT
jgi:signal transduction histidine kinase